MANSDTPLMRQYSEVKSRFSDSLLFFRMGDFYELFFEDAVRASKTLDIALTSRNKNDPNPVPMCGVPHHAATNYINKLVSAGFKVAICEQLEDPAEAKGIVRRDVVRVISPGTRLDPETLDAKAPNYTHAAVERQDGSVDWATCDFTTGKFWFGSAQTREHWFSVASAQAPAEVLFPDSVAGTELWACWRRELPQNFSQTVPSFYFAVDYAADRVREQFLVTTLGAVHPSVAARLEFCSPIGALIKYFQETQKAKRIPLATRLSQWGSELTMELDLATIRNLELLPARGPSRGIAAPKDLSLLSWLDTTRTAMGGRCLRDWLLRPLTSLNAIVERLDQVEALATHSDSSGVASTRQLGQELSAIYDIERLLARVSLGAGAAASPRELVALAQSVAQAAKLANTLETLATSTSQVSANAAHGIQLLLADIHALRNEPLLSLANEVLDGMAVSPLPATAREGGLFRKGFRPALDELIELSENGAQWLVEYEARERTKTGIQSLKVRYNRVFGYYIEVTKANLDAVPSHYSRKQTMVGGERFVTEELKQFEERILTAERKRTDLEYALFKEFCARFSEATAALSRLAITIGTIDVLHAAAARACEPGFCRPDLDETIELEIINGRHPTAAAVIPDFVPNSVHLSEKHPFLIITGPNMGGKSTVMRQTALIMLLAQIGWFVPAQKARIGISDRIFTRIGSADNLADGSSTFMVEMSEMSFILRHATQRSLILIDEIGRGTSTYDGMSLAWALASDLASRVCARTLFATHYHELTQLSQVHTTVSNARVGVEVSGPSDADASQNVRFLYRLETGVAERSYGILVARLAGLPDVVLREAQTMLAQLEEQAKRVWGHRTIDTQQLRLAFPVPAKAPSNDPVQHRFLGLLDQLRALDLNSTTPMAALQLLWQWRAELSKSGRAENLSDGASTQPRLN